LFGRTSEQESTRHVGIELRQLGGHHSELADLAIAFLRSVTVPTIAVKKGEHPGLLLRRRLGHPGAQSADLALRRRGYQEPIVFADHRIHMPMQHGDEISGAIIERALPAEDGTVQHRMGLRQSCAHARIRVLVYEKGKILSARRSRGRQAQRLGVSVPRHPVEAVMEADQTPTGAGHGTPRARSPSRASRSRHFFPTAAALWFSAMKRCAAWARRATSLLPAATWRISPAA